MHPTRIEHARPVATEALWTHPICLPCEQHPEGLPGMVWIESLTQRRLIGCNYLVIAHVGQAGELLGFRFTRATDEGEISHDVDLEHGPVCECPDSLFRKRPCKHVRAVERMPDPIRLPATTHRSAAEAEAAEGIVFYPVLNAVGEPIEPPDRAA
jgi:hypothetical protein